MFALLYQSADDVAATAPIHFPAHKARLDDFRARGELLLVGPFGDQKGSMGIFLTKEGALEFAAQDPFVPHGVVRS